MGFLRSPPVCGTGQDITGFLTPCLEDGINHLPVRRHFFKMDKEPAVSLKCQHIMRVALGTPE